MLCFLLVVPIECIIAALSVGFKLRKDGERLNKDMIYTVQLSFSAMNCIRKFVFCPDRSEELNVLMCFPPPESNFREE